MVAQQLPCCIYLDVLMWKYLECPGKVTGYHPILPCFIGIGPDLRLKVINLKMELKVIFGCLLYDHITWLPCTSSGDVKIIIVAALLRSYRALVTV